MHIHILGICGTFMAGVARLAAAAGHKVTGSDANVYPPMSDQLKDAGIELMQGYNAEDISIKPDLWVIGNAIGRGNPLLEEILDRGEPYTSGAAVVKRKRTQGPARAGCCGYAWKDHYEFNAPAHSVQGRLGARLADRRSAVGHARFGRLWSEQVFRDRS